MALFPSGGRDRAKTGAPELAGRCSIYQRSRRSAWVTDDCAKLDWGAESEYLCALGAWRSRRSRTVLQRRTCSGHANQFADCIESCMIKDDPNFYNPASYLLCGALIFLWAGKVLRSAFCCLERHGSHWPSSRPPYHASCLSSDRMTLSCYLLAIPACAILWAERNANWSAPALPAVTTAGRDKATAGNPMGHPGLTLLRHIQPRPDTVVQTS